MASATCCESAANSVVVDAAEGCVGAAAASKPGPQVDTGLCAEYIWTRFCKYPTVFTSDYSISIMPKCRRITAMLVPQIVAEMLL
jgi:hypothetical protein